MSCTWRIPHCLSNTKVYFSPVQDIRYSIKAKLIKYVWVHDVPFMRIRETGLSLKHLYTFQGIQREPRDVWSCNLFLIIYFQYFLKIWKKMGLYYLLDITTCHLGDFITHKTVSKNSIYVLLLFHIDGAYVAKTQQHYLQEGNVTSLSHYHFVARSESHR